ncbi:MAG TPA: hypothetical protein VMF30_00110 [Pirellulales bacterium]|nr:hypothetical protein [Pirellulales bacterium]
MASLLVPVQLDWRQTFGVLPVLHRQLVWVYGGYTLLSIVAIGLITVTNAGELAAGGMLARSFCGYAFAFWGIRLALVPVLRVREHLDRWWLRLGYIVLTLAFAYLALIFGWASFARPLTA